MLLESNVQFVIDKSRLFYRKIFSHRRISTSSSNLFLIVARLVSVNFSLVTRIIYRFLLWSIRANLMLDNFHICYSTRYIDESFDITRRIFSRSLMIIHHHSKFSLKITHRHSTHSSRSLIDSWSIRHDRSSTLLTSARYQLKLWKINSSKLAQIFKKKILSRFQIRDLLVRFVSTSYESRHSNIFRLRRSIYTL